MSKMFKPVDWSIKCNIYEVNVRQYSIEGTFEAFGRHIPRLRDMGVEVLWFMPITPISTLGRQGSLGSYYACSDYTSINPEYGTLDDFRAVVNLAHEHGMKVIIDWVANHTGWEHTWVKTNPEFYKRNSAGEFYDSNNWNDVIDLNYYDQNMRRAMIDAMRFWVTDAGIDGFRCDMAHLVPLDFWRNARLEIDKLRPLFWLAETEQVNYDEVFDCIYAWNWMHQTEAFFKKAIGMQQLHESLNAMEQRFPGCTHLLFTANHDENSWNGTEYEKYGSGAQALAVFSATWKSVPLIYSGQEAPNNKRLQFFDRDPIEWPQAPLLHDFYQTLLRLRREHPAIDADKSSIATLLETGEYEKVIAFTRSRDDRRVVVILNLSDQDAVITVHDPNLNGIYQEIFTKEETDIQTGKQIALKGGEYTVLAN
ncbi:MAG TPA: alpha-amylase family glycosyl hydrolase [Flavitalea sp.]|nr:alpha-amylase family glycosyl hydrolase [Flavitalea sp.]